MSLYRKYRPQNFADLVGQDHIKRTLQAAIAQDKIAHSYLFSGPRGIGKTTVARILAKAANCTLLRQGAEGQVADKDRPCGKCASCKLIAGGQSMDIIEIDAASNRGIDEIRELRDKVRFAPTAGKYKVYIIDEVHMLTKEAFNALLKTLEEPPPHAIFIMATTESHKVPATIISRCQRFDFKRATPKNLLDLLNTIVKAEKISAEPEALALIARAADGAHRDALTLLEQIAMDAQGKITADMTREKLGLIDEPLQWQFLQEIFTNRPEAAMKSFARFEERGIDWKYLYSSINKKLRLLLFYKLAPGVIGADLTPEESKRLQKLSAIADESRVVAVINMILRAEAQLKSSSMPELPLGAGLAEYFIGQSSVVSRQSGNGRQRTEDGIDGKEKSYKKIDNSIENGKQRIENSEYRIENINHSSQIAPLDEIKWTAIVAQVKKNNTALARLLKQSHPYQSAKELIVEVPYKLWEEKVKGDKSKESIIEAAQSEGFEIKLVTVRSNGDLKQKLVEQADSESKKVKQNIREVFG